MRGTRMDRKQLTLVQGHVKGLYLNLPNDVRTEYKEKNTDTKEMCIV